MSSFLDLLPHQRKMRLTHALKVRVYHCMEQDSKIAAHAISTWGGVPLPRVTKLCGFFNPKANNTLGWALPSKGVFLWGRNESKLTSSLSALGTKDPHGFILCKRCEQFLRLALTSKKNASHSCLINLS